MKKYIVETVEISKWIWEVKAESEDEAKYHYDQGFVVSKSKETSLTIKEA